MSPRDYLLAYRAKRAGASGALSTVQQARELGIHPALAIAVLEEADYTPETALIRLANYVGQHGVRRGLWHYYGGFGYSRASVRAITENTMQRYANWHAVLEVGKWRKLLPFPLSVPKQGDVYRHLYGKDKS